MNTKQRTVILEELQKLTSHPTADELFQRVRKHIPNISLGTVYRNLNQMAEAGTIIKLGKAGEQKRFDAITDKHYHLFCTTCGKVYDLPTTSSHDLDKIVNDIKEHEVYDYDLEFYGKCKLCKQKENKDDTTR